MTISSALDIYNAALSAVHGKGRLSSLTEASREREECDIWYDITLRVVQEAAFWPSSRKAVYLALVDERNFSSDWVDTNPLPEYKYKYTLPADCLRPWHLTSFERFSLSHDAVNKTVVLNTNTPNAALIYGAKQTLVGLWTSEQTMATIYGLAGHIAGSLTGRGELVQKNFQLANQYLQDAQASAANSEDQLVNSVPPTLIARGYTGAVNSPQYFYPYGNFFGAASTT